MTCTARRSLLLAGAAFAALGSTAARAEPELRRVVSLNPCLDVILAFVADREQIAAFSHLARDPNSSSVPVELRSLPITYESAEEIAALRPDLVVTSRHSSLATRNAMRRLSIRAELFGVPRTVAESTAQVTKMAALVSRPERGVAVLQQIEAALAAAAPPPDEKPVTALVFQPNGFAAGPGTLIDEMLTRCGFTNMAGAYGLRQWGNVMLERLLADPPRMLLAGIPQPGVPSWADRVMTHPALKSIGGRMLHTAFPERLIYCGGPVLLDTAAALSAARNMAREAG